MGSIQKAQIQLWRTGMLGNPVQQSADLPRPARLAVAVLFFLTGLTFASWAARIPAIQSKPGLSPGMLGLFCNLSAYLERCRAHLAACFGNSHSHSRNLWLCRFSRRTCGPWLCRRCLESAYRSGDRCVTQSMRCRVRQRGWHQTG